MKRYVKVAAFVVAVLFGAWVVMTLLTVLIGQEASRDDRADLRAQLDVAQEEIDTNAAAAEILARQVEGLGEEPVVQPPAVSPGALTPPSVRFLPVPGQQGEEGPPPSFAAVLDAVDRLLADALVASCGGSCRGEDGESIQGPPGETVVGQKGDVGETGQKGETGAKGDPGRGVRSAVCGDDGRWTVTYTDDTTSDGGRCLPLAPDPEPTPEPTPEETP